MRLLRTSLYVPFGDARLYFHPRVGLLDLSVCSHPVNTDKHCRRCSRSVGVVYSAVGGRWELQARPAPPSAADGSSRRGPRRCPRRMGAPGAPHLGPRPVVSVRRSASGGCAVKTNNLVVLMCVSHVTKLSIVPRVNWPFWVSSFVKYSFKHFACFPLGLSRSY